MPGLTDVNSVMGRRDYSRRTGGSSPDPGGFPEGGQVDDRLRAIEARLSEMERSLGELNDRLERLEGSRGAPPVAGPAFSASGEDEAGWPAATDEASSVEGVLGIPTLVGRTSLVLGGAFMLRWLTESGTVSQVVGVALGLAYAALWLVLADRAAARERRLSGAVHAFTASLIAFPLTWEAVDRFHVLPPPVGAAILVVVAAAGLAVAWRNSFRTVAWITILFVLGTGIGLLFRTKDVTAFGTLLLALAVGSLVIAYGRGWRTQRWIVALVLDLVVLLLTFGHLHPEHMLWLETEPLVALQAGLALVYLAAFGLRLFLQGRFVTSFAILQGLLCWVIGFEGAVLCGGAAVRPVFGAAALLTAALAWLAAARVLAHHPRSAALAFGWFSTLGAVSAAEGLRLLLPSGWACTAWGLAAVLLAVLGLLKGRAVLQWQAAGLATGAAAGCGLLPATVGAFIAPAAGPWSPFTVWAATVLVLLLATAALLHRAAASTTHPAATVVRALYGFVVVVVLAGGAARLAAGPLAAAPGEGADAGALAVVRMGALAAAALLLAAARAWTGRVELTWLFYGVLAFGGLKLLAEDLRSGQPGLAAVSLGLFGLALVLGSRLARRGNRVQEPRPEEPSADGA